MRYQSFLFVLASVSMLMGVASAIGPADFAGAPLQEQISQAQSQLQQKARDIAGGNLTLERLEREVNATARDLGKKAEQEIAQHTNLSQKDLQQKAKEELKKQATQAIQQPGFEAVFAAAGFLATALCLCKRR